MTTPPTFAGLSAFPLTPIRDDVVDEAAFARLVDRLADAGVDSIGALGSTGSYVYLSREERARVVRIAVEHSRDVPVIAGIGALRTRDVRALAADAQDAGAAAVLLAPVSYQSLTRDDVFGLYDDVTRELDVPLVVYDNPGTTRFTFDDELYAAIAALPNVASIKIPPIPGGDAGARERIAELRRVLPAHVKLGISGDAAAADALSVGADAWYSVIGGTLPGVALEITRAAQAGEAALAGECSAALAPVWALMARHGSLRVVAAIAEQLGLAERSCLPLPIRGLDDDARAELADALAATGLAEATRLEAPSAARRPVDFWEERYASADGTGVWSGNVNATMSQIVAELPAGRALDLGCGEGADVAWLASRGWDATGVDLSRTAIERATALASTAGESGSRMRFVVSDLAEWTSAAEDAGEGFDLVTASFLQAPPEVELPRLDILRQAARLVRPGGHLLVVGHAAPPPWAPKHEHSHTLGHEHSTPEQHAIRFPTPAQDLEALSLGEHEWETLIVETRSRPAVGPDGTHAHLDDGIVLVRRRTAE